MSKIPKPLHDANTRPLQNPSFARFLCQAQISIFEILLCIPAVKIIALLELGQNWILFKGLDVTGECQSQSEVCL